MVAQHIANGMYGMILVEPEEGLAPVDREFYVMQGEIYTQEAFGTRGELIESWQKLMDQQPEYYVFNGAVHGLKTEAPLRAGVGETIRIFFGVGGPNKASAFHVIGEIFDEVYPLGSVTGGSTLDVQTVSVPPGGAMVAELTLEIPGQYVLVDHALSRVERGPRRHSRGRGPGQPGDLPGRGRASGSPRPSEPRLPSHLAAGRRWPPRGCELRNERLPPASEAGYQVARVIHPFGPRGTKEQSMSRQLTVAAAQMGPIAREESRQHVVARLLELMLEAKARGAGLVVFPELALTTFFPRWWLEDEAEIDAFFEADMPNAATRPLFEAAAEQGVGFYLGYAELVRDGGRKRRFNSSILVDERGRIVGKYRKVHLPGHAEHEPWRPFQHLEKRYFEPGDLGFPTFDALGGRLGMCICNDRRWPETYRVMGLQGAELILLGYNTPQHYPLVPQHDHLNHFHNHLVMQAGAYQNGCWVVGVAKCGIEEGCMLIGQSCIIAPTGEIVAMCTTLEDELAVAVCDLDRCGEIREHIFNFALHRQPQHYGLIAARSA